MTQAAAAAAMGITQSAFSDKMHGRRRFTLDDLERFSESLGISLGQLLEPPALLVEEAAS